MNIIRGTYTHSRIALVYGEPGIGKTTLAARVGGIRHTLLLDLEGRSGHVSVDRAIIDDWAGLRAALSEAQRLPYDIVCIDTLDRAQDLAVHALLQARGWDSIEAPGYGRGYVELRSAMLALADDIEALRQSGRGILLLAHAMRQRVEDPVHGEWDRWSVKLHDAARSSVAALFIERVDVIALAACAVARVGRDDARTARLGERMLYTTPHAGRLTKCVCEPVDMPLDQAPAWLSAALVPTEASADRDAARKAYEEIERRLGGRDAVRSLLRERGLSARTMSAEQWRALLAEVEEVPQ
mgnify:FL=1